MSLRSRAHRSTPARMADQYSGASRVDVDRHVAKRGVAASGGGRAGVGLQRLSCSVDVVEAEDGRAGVASAHGDPDVAARRPVWLDHVDGPQVDRATNAFGGAVVAGVMPGRCLPAAVRSHTAVRTPQEQAADLLAGLAVGLV